MSGIDWDKNGVASSDFQKRESWQTNPPENEPSEADRRANILEGKHTFWVGICNKCGLGYGLHREIVTQTTYGEQSTVECPQKS